MENDELDLDELEQIKAGQSSLEAIEKQKEYLNELRIRLENEKNKELTDEELENIKAGRNFGK